MTSQYLERIFNGPSRVCSMQIVFVDIVAYSRRRPVRQVEIIDVFTKLLESTIHETSRNFLSYAQHHDINFRKDIVILPTGDGAVIGFPFEDVEGIHLYFSRELIRQISKNNKTSSCDFKNDGWCHCHNSFYVRIGVSYGQSILYKDINQNYNIAGNPINMASRVMGCADRNQILFTEEAYTQLEQFFKGKKSPFHKHEHVAIKFGLEISVFQYLDKTLKGLNNELITDFERKDQIEEISNPGKNEERPNEPLKEVGISKLILKVKSDFPALYSELKDHFVMIPSGQFKMNEVENDGIDVLISKSFYMGEVPVTQQFYEEVMSANPSKFKGDDLPVVNVSWFDATRFCNELSHRCGLDVVYQFSGKKVRIDYSKPGFRLPTEAEWEYACRANTPGDRYGEVKDIAWYDTVRPPQPQAVKHKDPNSFGLYDMLGNVWEWCNDWHENKISNPDGVTIDPIGPEGGFQRVMKGGSWANPPAIMRCNAREKKDPDTGNDNRGFRIVISQQSNQSK
jgi:formylglycine-generating enzyme required for sulfatase activity/class 3 adenylate cyclase